MSSLGLRQSSFNKWMQTNYEPDELRDIARYGAQNGFHGLIYYRETERIYDRYHQDIWNMIHEDADNIGLTPLALISSFNGEKNVFDEGTFKNLLVWYAAEKVAFELTEN